MTAPGIHSQNRLGFPLLSFCVSGTPIIIVWPLLILPPTSLVFLKRNLFIYLFILFCWFPERSSIWSFHSKLCSPYVAVLPFMPSAPCVFPWCAQEPANHRMGFGNPWAQNEDSGWIFMYDLIHLWLVGHHVSLGHGGLIQNQYPLYFKRSGYFPVPKAQLCWLQVPVGKSRRESSQYTLVKSVASITSSRPSPSFKGLQSMN